MSASGNETPKELTLLLKKDKIVLIHLSHRLFYIIQTLFQTLLTATIFEIKDLVFSLI